MINKTSEQLRTLMRLSAFFYFDRIRALLCVSGLLLVAVSAHAETKIHALTKVIEGHSTGGVTVDALGNIYVADFGEIVWKITPEGKRDVFASGLYGASGNAIDHEGNLLQSNFYGDAITKIDRKGQAGVGRSRHDTVRFRLGLAFGQGRQDCRTRWRRDRANARGDDRREGPVDLP